MTTRLLLASAIILSSVALGAQQPTPGQTAPPKASTASPTAQPPRPRGPLLGDYMGALPCTDCIGFIRTELMLYTTSADATNYGTYTIVRSFISQHRDGLQWNETHGGWVLVYGTPEDPGAPVYRLTADPPAAPQYFLRVSDTAVRLLDAQRRVFAPIANSILTRLPPPDPGLRVR